MGHRHTCYLVLQSCSLVDGKYERQPCSMDLWVVQAQRHPTPTPKEPSSSLKDRLVIRQRLLVESRLSQDRQWRLDPCIWVRTFWHWLLRNKWPIPRRPRHLPSRLPAYLSTPSTQLQLTDPCESPSQGSPPSFHCLPICAWSFISSQIIQFFILHSTLRSFSFHMLKESHLPVWGSPWGGVYTAVQEQTWVWVVFEGRLQFPEVQCQDEHFPVLGLKQCYP